MIDTNLRSRYFEQKKTEALINGMKETLASVIKENKFADTAKTEHLINGMKHTVMSAIAANKGADPSVGDAQQYYQTLSDQVNQLAQIVASSLNVPAPKVELPSLIVEHDSKLAENVDKIGKVLTMVYETITRPLPDIFKVKGEVEVTKPVKIENLRELEKYFQSLEKKFGNMLLAVQAMPQPQIKIPKIEIPAQVKSDNPELLKLINKLNDNIEKLSTPAEIKAPGVKISTRRMEELLEFLVNRPQMVTQPVTHVSLNALQGQIFTTLVTVQSSQSTELPPSPAANRRSVMIFNSSATTVYIGGAGVTNTGANQGFPVLTNTSSPPIDAGKNMTVFGIAASGTVNVNVLEVCDEASGR